MNPKKYILKPGKHQFAPGSPAEHDNDNLNDAEAEWYLKAYPHIAVLFVERLEAGRTESTKEAVSDKPEVKRKQTVHKQNHASVSIKSLKSL